MKDDHISMMKSSESRSTQVLHPMDNKLESSAICLSALVDTAILHGDHGRTAKRRHASAKAILNGDDSKVLITHDQTTRYGRKIWEPIEPSTFAMDTINPIRLLVDVMNVNPKPDKALLKLHIGDPTITGVLPTHPNIVNAVSEALHSGRYNGYGPAIGFLEIRRQLADFLNAKNANERPVQTEDIILTSGCSHALQLAIEAVAGTGQNILVPRPGFPLYTTLMQPHGIESRFYNLLIDRGWEADLDHMESLIDRRTAAVIVNNPNNPTGAVYSRTHLEDILKLAHKYRIPIIADEIYGDMVYGNAQFHPLYTLKPKVPVLTCDGISKRYLVPGWRLGWLIISDSDNAIRGVRQAAQQLAQKIVGPCSLIQGALAAILHRTPMDFFDYNRRILSENVDIVCRELADSPGLKPIRAHGAMYIMIGIDVDAFPYFKNKANRDTVSAMARALIAEESLYCLPGSAFYYPNALRFVTTHKSEITFNACTRLKEFCQRYYNYVDTGTRVN